jgi:hypothetical protein
MQIAVAQTEAAAITAKRFEAPTPSLSMAIYLVFTAQTAVLSLSAPDGKFNLQ